MAGHCTVAPTGVSCVSPVLLTEGFLFVLGGQDENKQTLSSGEKYDPDANTWTALPPMNEVRCSSWLAVVLFSLAIALGVGSYAGKEEIAWPHPTWNPVLTNLPLPLLPLASCLAPPPCRDLPLTSRTAHLPYCSLRSQGAFPAPSPLSTPPLLCTPWLYMFLDSTARSFLCSVWAMGTYMISTSGFWDS